MAVPTREQVIALLTDPVHRGGAEVEDVEVSAAGAKSVVRVIVDAEAGLSLDDVVRLTGLVSDELDADTTLGSGPYTLEVTSRGVDRPLTLPRHWRRARGRRVEVQAGESPFVGRVGELRGDDAATAVVALAVPGDSGPELREVPLAAIERAVVQVEFSKPDPREIALTGAAVEPPAGTADAAPASAPKEKDK